MKRMLMSVAALAAVAAIGAAQAGGDPAAGKAKAQACATCHGANGEGKAKYPAIAGMPEADFVQLLQDYKSGKRPNPVMKTYAGKLSDADMENLAAYYASLKK